MGYNWVDAFISSHAYHNTSICIERLTGPSSKICSSSRPKPAHGLPAKTKSYIELVEQTTSTHQQHATDSTHQICLHPATFTYRVEECCLNVALTLTVYKYLILYWIFLRVNLMISGWIMNLTTLSQDKQTSSRLRRWMWASRLKSVLAMMIRIRHPLGISIM